MTTLMDHFRSQFPAGQDVELTIETTGGRRYCDDDIQAIGVADDGLMLALEDGSVAYITDDDLAFLRCKVVPPAHDHGLDAAGYLLPLVESFSAGIKADSMIEPIVIPMPFEELKARTTDEPPRPTFPGHPCMPSKDAFFGPCHESHPAEPPAVKGHDPFEPIPDIEGDDYTIHGDGSVERDCDDTVSLSGRVWECKVGFAGHLPQGADAPMRRAVDEAFRALTGVSPLFCFSGWGGRLTPAEQEVAGVGPGMRGRWELAEVVPPSDSQDFHSAELNYRAGADSHFSRLEVYAEDEEAARAIGIATANALNAAGIE